MHGELQQLASEHGTRLASFSAIGLSVFVMGFGLQALLVEIWHVERVVAYVLQGVVSIQVSFLLNYYCTWRDKHFAFWPACCRFNGGKVFTTLLNFGIYAGLIRLGVNYLAANVALMAVFTLVNYLLGHFWVFGRAGGTR
jgi:dolichol-phosphate mannosyltransferase